MLTTLKVTEMLANAPLGVSHNPVVILLLMNALLLALGLIIDMAPLILIMTPILLPIATDDVGMNPLHFDIMLLLNLSIGLITPPVASVLYIGTGVGGTSVESTTRATIHFYVTLVAVLLLVTFLPALAMTLPRLLGA